MKEKPLYEISANIVPEARGFAEWVSIQYDLKYVINTIDRLLDLMKNNQDDLLIRDLYISALVTYVRCFTSGVRVEKLSKDIFKTLNGDPIGAHDTYKNTRDKHIAHSVNVFEEIKVGLILSDEYEVQGVGMLYSSRIADDKEGLIQLKTLAIFALKYADSKVDEYNKSVLEKAKNLSKDKLAKLKKLRITPQGGLDASRSSR